MLKLFGLVVFRLTSNVAACKIAKPYVNKNGLPTQMTHLEKGELSVESKRFLHGRCVSDVLAPGMEALVYLVVYKLCLGHKGAGVGKGEQEEQGDGSCDSHCS